MKTAYLNPFPVPKIDFTTEQKKRESLLEDGKEKFRRLLDGKSSVKDVVTSARINDHEDVAYELLSELASKQSQLIGKKRSLNLNLLDYLGSYSNGPDLPDIGFFQPSSSNILDATTEDYDKLRVGDVKTERDDYSITVYAKARYKPDNEDEYETDRWGYTETDYFEAFTLTDLEEEEVALIDAFVPVAIDKGDGFAGFRDNATKTNSPIDRLKAITLPDPDDVADDLNRYVQTKERADELNEKIKKTDELIDRIVYDLYGLTEEEIGIIEAAVQDD